MQTVIDGVLTNYEVLGSKNQKTVLILHGWGQSIENWKTIAQKIANRYRVYLLDLPGFGSSSQSDHTFGLEEYTKYVNDFIKNENLKELALIGHSFGGKVSVNLASESPAIKQLFLISPSGIENKSFIVILKTLIFKMLKYSLFWMPQDIKEKYVLIFGSRDYKSAGNMRETFKKVIGEKVDQSARKINIPTIIIWGENDKELGLKNALKLKGLIKNSTLRVLWGLGHSPNIESPEKLANLLLEYL